ncbi:hypothetical protein C6H68_02655 [Photorhabdus luminescens]|nr:hypothetical protein C6H68_02655 [Photorhabdus luminescens]
MADESTSILYAPAYDAVLSLCLMVEAGWRYEVGDYQQQGFTRPMLGIIPIGACWRIVTIGSTANGSGLVTASRTLFKYQKKPSLFLVLCLLSKR